MVSNNLVNELDKIIRWPKKPSDKEIVVDWLSKKFELGLIYSEKEVNNIIKIYHLFNDIPLLRRELVSRKYLIRKDDGSEYWKADK
tara:strand:- start:689 stop:946 length:258 start_codon:yes stop_codon:yes gene_type:complete